MGWRDAPTVEQLVPAAAPAAPPTDPFDALMQKAQQPAAAPPPSAGVSASDGDPFAELVKKTIGAPDPASETDNGQADAVLDAISSVGQALGGKKPTAEEYLPSDPADNPAAVAAGNIVNGIPIIGPNIFKGVNQATAWIKANMPESMGGGGTFESNLQTIEDTFKRGNEKHPTAAAVGGLAGQMGGYGLAVTAAPAAFGLGMSSLPASMAVSGATNALISRLDAKARDEDPDVAGLVGGALGAVSPMAAAAFQRFLKPAIEPFMAKLADAAVNKFNIPLSGDQLSKNPFIRMTGSVAEKLPGTGGTAARAQRQIAFNKAIAAEMGEVADRLTPDVMNAARQRIGGMFENAAKQTPTIGADQQLGNDLNLILKDIRDPVDRALSADERKVVEKQMGRVLELFSKSGNGTITGQQYQQLTRFGTPLDKAIKSQNPNIAFYAGQIKDALDGALERFAPPEALAELRAARYQWKVMKTIEGLSGTDGNIAPAKLMHEVDKRWPNMAFDQVGKSPMVDLARIGQTFLKEPGSSNTSERAAILKAFEVVGGAAGMHLLMSNPIATTGGAIAPIVAGRLMGTMLRARPLVRGLINSSLNGPGAVSRSIPAATMIGAETTGKNALLPSDSGARSTATGGP